MTAERAHISAFLPCLAGCGDPWTAQSQKTRQGWACAPPLHQQSARSNAAWGKSCPPDDVHHGRARQRIEQRRRTLNPAWGRHPERFVRGRPKPRVLPETVWIHPPKATATVGDAQYMTSLAVSTELPGSRIRPAERGPTRKQSRIDAGSGLWAHGPQRRSGAQASSSQLRVVGSSLGPSTVTTRR